MIEHTLRATIASLNLAHADVAGLAAVIRDFVIPATNNRDLNMARGHLVQALVNIAAARSLLEKERQRREGAAATT